MEELPEDDANENLRINKVTEIIRDYIQKNYMYDLSVQQMAERQIIQSLISAGFSSRVWTEFYSVSYRIPCFHGKKC